MKVFVTGTDTGVGKTFVSSWLCLHTGAAYVKPIQTGGSRGSDTEWVAQLGVRTCPETYVFREARAPHQAAAREGRKVRIRDITLPKIQDLVIEGAGGVLVPLNAEESMADLMRVLAVPVLVVARAGLGTINHTRLSLEALEARGIRVLGTIVSGEGDFTCASMRILQHLPQCTKIDAHTLSTIPMDLALRRALYDA